MVGNNQLDLVQTIVALLAPYPQPTLQALLANIVLVGGGSVVPGLRQRLERDLVRECPVGSRVGVRVGKGGANGAFLGMQYIGRHERELLERMSYKREEYLSEGESGFVSNPWSNPKPK
jgi:actin-related protein